MSEGPKKGRGRPAGKRYPRVRSLKLRQADDLRLEELAEKLDRDHSWIIRHAIERLAVAEGVEKRVAARLKLEGAE